MDFIELNLCDKVGKILVEAKNCTPEVVSVCFLNGWHLISSMRLLSEILSIVLRPKHTLLDVL